MTCMLGQCYPNAMQAQVRCGKHAALYEVRAMEDRGWVPVATYADGINRRLDDHFMDMVRGVQMASLDMQRGLVGWDDDTNLPQFGIWAPRVVAVTLSLCGDILSAEDLAEVLRAAKVDQDFIQAVDAGYRMGGNDAAMEMIKARMPRLTFKTRKP